MESYCTINGILLDISILLEQQWCECVQIQTPVSPSMTTLTYEEGMLQTLLSQCLVKSLGALKQEVCITTCQPVKFITIFLQSLQLLDALFCRISTHGKWANVIKHRRIKL